MRVLTDGKLKPNTDVSVVVTPGTTLVLGELSPGRLGLLCFYFHCFYYLLSAAGAAPLSSRATRTNGINPPARPAEHAGM